MACPSSPRTANPNALLAIAFLAPPMLLEAGPSIAALPLPVGWYPPKIVELVAVVLLAVWAHRQRWLPPLELSIALGALFVCHAAISGLWAADAAGYGRALLKLVHHAAAAFVIYVAVRRRRDLDLVLCGWFLVSFLAAVLTVVEAWFPGWRIGRVLSGDGPRLHLAKTEANIAGAFYRANGPLGHPTYQGLFFTVSLLLTPYLWERFSSFRLRRLLVFATIVVLYAFLLCYARLPVIGLGVGACWLLLIGGRRYRLLVAAGLVAVAIGGLLMPSSWIMRLANPRHLRYSKSVGFRLDQMTENVALARKHALIGVGYGGYGVAYHQQAPVSAVNAALTSTGWRGAVIGYNASSFGAHNTYLEVLIEQGVAGLGMLVALGLALYWGVRGASARNKGDPVAAGLGRILAAALVAQAVMFLLVHAQGQRTPWFLLGVAASYVRLAAPDGMPRESLGLGAWSVRAGELTVYGLSCVLAVLYFLAE